MSPDGIISGALFLAGGRRMLEARDDDGIIGTSERAL